MLDPHSRVLYLDALRPPPDYILDKAIATTFSLDLLSLLMAPLSMIFAGQGTPEDLLKDPIAFLESLQRIQDKLVVFCQAGRIAIPKVDTRLYSYLEPVVIEVQPPSRGVFHPKLWLLRFQPKADGDAVMYRLLCLSRNLTFDRSWDTLLSLDGHLETQRQRGFSLNRALVDFIQALPGLTMPGRSVSPAVRNMVNELAAEVARVRFELPADFEEIVAFRPVGIEGHKRLSFPEPYRRLLVVSPFLTNQPLQDLLANGSNNILISRPDSLDKLSPAVVTQLQANTKIYVMNELAEQPDDADRVDDETDTTTDDLSGLHAKLYIAEDGWQATVLTGSANASDAGLKGLNVEFMVELNGKRSQIGIDSFLGQENQKTSLLSMLQLYQPAAQPPNSETKLRQHLEQTLNEARYALTMAGLTLAVTPGQDGTYTLTLQAAAPVSWGQQALTGCCYPISRDRQYALDLTPLLTRHPVTFTQVSLEGLTGFIAFEFLVVQEGQQVRLKFVLNLPVKGMPTERNQRLLQSLIADKERFIRYLLFLLADDQEFGMQELVEWTQSGRAGAASTGAGLPLLEELVRAASRHPEKFQHIARLVDNLRQTQPEQTLFPEGFEQIWAVFLRFEQQRGQV